MYRNTENTRAVIFDGDDTLWETQAEYEKAKAQFFQLMERLGFDVKDVQTRFAQTDVANVENFGFSKHRFPASMQAVYLSFCKEKHVEIDQNIANRVQGIGYSVFLQKPLLKTNTISILKSLRQKYSLYLFTSGDPDIQQYKIRELSIAPLFRNIYITERKDAKEFQRIIHQENIDPKKSWMVGNSLRSDINPAVQVGLRAIWVRAGSWEYDQVLLSEGNVWVVDSLDEITGVIQEIDSYSIA